jgi:predicted Zn-dependent protease
VPFEVIARQAEEAWSAGRTEEALSSYAAGVELDPRWSDGWWRLGQIHANAGRYAEAREALLRLVALRPEAGPAWALLGLCEYRLHAYDRALAYLWRGTSLGVDDDALGRQARLHFGILLLREGDFGAASKPLARLAQSRFEEPAFVTACGLLALRRPGLPEDLPASDLDLVRSAGRPWCDGLAARNDEAKRGFEELVARYPDVRGVHFAYGFFLRWQAAPEGLAQIREEVRRFPDNAEAQAELAFEILERGEKAEDALGPARESVRLVPESGRGRLALGRALVATGDLPNGLVELEQAARLIPDDSDVHLALAKAYAAAGRTADVERERTRLRELDRRRGSGTP